MNIHFHIGPGHHEKILTEGLKYNGVLFSVSNYHPEYTFTDIRIPNKIHGSFIYSFIKYLSWGISNRLRFLRKKNQHLNIPYLVYDLVSSQKISDIELLWCWPQVSLSIIKKVKRNKGKVIIDYPIPHIWVWNKTLKKEQSKYNVSSTHSFFSSFLEKRMLKEISLADRILVPSEFVFQSFIDSGVSKEKLILNPYGIDTSFFKPLHSVSKKEKFTILFVGTVELRKGVHYLAEAFSGLDSNLFEMRVAGTVHDDFKHAAQALNIESNKTSFLGQVPKEQIVKEMNQADVMVMPSLLEGLSLTILECMACGTPVISTFNAGGPEVIIDGVNGFLVPACNSTALQEKLEWCQKNRKKLSEMGIKAREKIINGNSQEDYLKRSLEIINSLT